MNTSPKNGPKQMPSFLDSIKDWADGREIHAEQIGNKILVWDYQTLISAGCGSAIFELDINLFNPKLKSWFPDGVETPLSHLASHIVRTNSADLVQPVSILPDRRILDGHHRYLKAIIEGRTHLECKIVQNLPPADKVILL